jgi:uncharacterized protein Usg
MSLTEAFLAADRVTASIFYYQPLQVGQAPLKIKSPLLGQPVKMQNHSALLQEFIYQKDDRADLDPSLQGIFKEVMIRNSGIIKIYDRRLDLGETSEQEQMALQTDLADGVKIPSAVGVPVTQIIIPRMSETLTKAEDEINVAFRTLIPFPSVRRFLQMWQEKIEAPLHHVRFAACSAAQSSYGNQWSVN